ncbi:VWA domain-containing protein, partial [Oceaniglobus roseus]|uniref:VWA domain-containing protein n=1 Tax=Oceaniglobus roseus TaxID=1737570 RepID=UPI0012FFEF5A
APEALPRRISYRRRRAARGDRLDARRTLREAARRGGDVLRLFETRRKTRQRRVMLLIDVSGSMRERSGPAMRLAHALVQAAERCEVFTLGTRLTRITGPLRVRDLGQALERVGAAIADFDGGTRIGEALQALLAVPRYAGFARGAAVVVLSDGLERGDPAAMVDAVRRLSRSAWALTWLTPLAADPDYRPETAAMAGILPVLDRLGDGATLGAVVDHILDLSKHGRRAA